MAARWSFTILAFVASTGVGWAQAVPSAAQVQAAIERSVQDLIGAQDNDGGWPELSEYSYGVSSLVTLALLSAGLEPQSPAVSRALNYISRGELDRTYTVSLQTMALCAANPNRFARQIERNVQWLIKAQSQGGGWSYSQAIGNLADPSNSQFALLALHEAQRVGIGMDSEAARKCLAAAREYWFALQQPDGGFSYGGGMGLRAA